MRTLWVLRHAKSAWDDPTLADHDRPLKPRGQRAALEIGRLLAEQPHRPTRVLCSSAVRARETWFQIQSVWTGPLPEVLLLPALYPAEPPALTAIIATWARDSTPLVIGHNPSLESWITALTGKSVLLPTATLVELACPTGDWSVWGRPDAGGVMVSDANTAATTIVPTTLLVNVWRPRELAGPSAAVTTPATDE